MIIVNCIVVVVFCLQGNDLSLHLTLPKVKLPEDEQYSGYALRKKYLAVVQAPTRGDIALMPAIDLCLRTVGCDYRLIVRFIGTGKGRAAIVVLCNSLAYPS